MPEAQRGWWEILPQVAKSGEVILSKRNELGILSNFAATSSATARSSFPRLEASSNEGLASGAPSEMFHAVRNPNSLAAVKVTRAWKDSGR